MHLSGHDKEVLEKMKGAGWTTQHQLKTSRQTLNKLISAKLVERKITNDRIRYLPETGTLYRLKKMDDNNVKSIIVSCSSFTASRLRNNSSDQCFK